MVIDGQLGPVKDNEDELLVELIEVLEEIDTDNLLSDLNAISMSDRKGGRIYF